MVVLKILQNGSTKTPTNVIFRKEKTVVYQRYL